MAVQLASHVPKLSDAPASLAGLAGARPRPGIETAFDVDRESLIDVLRALRDDHDYQQLMEIAGVDHPSRPERFEVVYCLLSLTRNHRVRVHVTTDEATPLPTATILWPVANWLEREVFDMYGVAFAGHPDLRRILTDYGFNGHPQRKDFPLTGHVELRYSEAEKRVVYEPVSLPQDFRNFEFLMPWEGPAYRLPGDEKATAEAAGAPSPVPAPNAPKGGEAPQAPAGNVTPKTTDGPAQTGAGKAANAAETRNARKSNKAKAASEVSKRPRKPKA
jgi:NADH-quinone oxidoreductase subunit C